MGAHTAHRVPGLLWRAAPVLGLGLAVHAGIALVHLLAVGAGAVLGHGLSGAGAGAAAGWPTVAGAFIGFVLGAGARLRAGAQLLYRLRARQLAVLAYLLEDCPVPGGREQLRFAAAVVRARFADASRLCALDRLVRGILAECAGAMLTGPGSPPRPGLGQRGAAQLLGAVLDRSQPGVDALVLVHAIRSRQASPWAAARDGTVLFAENQHLLRPAARGLTLLAWLLAVAVLLAVLAPVSVALAGVAVVPASALLALVVAAVLAWGAKAALIDPLLLACLVQAGYPVLRGQQPRQAWASRLNAASGRFRVLGERALAWVEREPSRTDAGRVAGLPFPERIG